MFFIMSNSSEVNRFDLSIPNDFRTAKFVHELMILLGFLKVGGLLLIEMVQDYILLTMQGTNTPNLLKTFSLSPAFDINICHRNSQC